MEIAGLQNVGFNSALAELIAQEHFNAFIHCEGYSLILQTISS
jgi:hypothetical protein